MDEIKLDKKYKPPSTYVDNRHDEGDRKHNRESSWRRATQFGSLVTDGSAACGAPSEKRKPKKLFVNIPTVKDKFENPKIYDGNDVFADIGLLPGGEDGGVRYDRSSSTDSSGSGSGSYAPGKMRFDALLENGSSSGDGSGDGLESPLSDSCTLGHTKATASPDAFGQISDSGDIAEKETRPFGQTDSVTVPVASMNATPSALSALLQPNENPALTSFDTQSTSLEQVAEGSGSGSWDSSDDDEILYTKEKPENFTEGYEDDE